MTIGRISGLAIAALVGFSGGCHPQTHRLQCIVPPITEAHRDFKSATKVGVELEQLPINVELKANFKRILDDKFAVMSDENVALALFLNAIDCYLQRGPAGETIAIELARELMLMVKARWAAEKSLLGASLELTPIEKNILMKDESGWEALGQYEELLGKLKPTS
jgi:hypothetical protein